MTPTQSPTLVSQATAELPESEFCAWMQEDRVMNAFPWGVGDPAKWDRDGHWAAKHFRREPLFTADQMNAHYLAGVEAGRASRAQSEWQPIKTAPKEGRTMFVVRGFDVTDLNCGARRYTTDPYCVWPGDGGGWVRWPHVFPPTHWVPLPATLGETK